MLTPALRSKVDALWDKFWSGGIANPLTAIEQISYPDGRVWEFPPEIAYIIWLAGPGTAIRMAGDNRTVMPWEYYAGATSG